MSARCTFTDAAGFRCLLPERHQSGHDQHGFEVELLAEGKCLNSSVRVEDCRGCDIGRGTIYEHMCQKPLTGGSDETSGKEPPQSAHYRPADNA